MKNDAQSTAKRLQNGDVIELSTLLNILWRGRWILFLCACVAVLLGGIFAYRIADREYTATTVVVMDAQINPISDLSSAMTGLTGDSEEITTEVEILRSRRLAGKVVDRLDLVNDPEFNFLLRPDGLVDRGKNFVKEQIGKVSPSLAYGEQPLLDLTPEQRTQRERDTVITALLSHYSVYNVPKSLVFRLSVVTSGPVKSSEIANTLAEIYILDQIAVKFEETEKAVEWLSDRVSQFQQDLETAEAKLASFSSSIQLVSAEMLGAQEVQLKDLRDRITQAENSAQQARMLLSDLALASDREAKAAILNDANLDGMVQSGLDTDTDRARFDARLRSLEDQLQTRADRLEQQIPTMKASEVQLTDRLSQQTEDLIVLQQYEREAEAERLQYEYFLGRLKETRAQQGIQQADSRIVSPAVIPNQPSAPKKPVILVFSCILGTFLGMCIVLLLETRKNGLRKAQDLEQRFGYSVLGQIPMAPGRERQKVLQYLIDKPASAMAEAYRSLRTSVMMTAMDTPPKIIMNTSCVPGEGKTTNSLGLAYNLVGMGKKVILVEGDIRRRTLETYFPDMSHKLGLIAAMNGEASLEEIVYKDPKSGLYVLGGETTKMNAADVFSLDSFKDLMKTLRNTYDVVVIDCPPVLVVPDARIIARHVDSVLFTVKWDSTSEYEVEEALRVFHASGQKIDGFVLGQIDLQRMKSYGSYTQYSAYANYGSEYYHN